MTAGTSLPPQLENSGLRSVSPERMSTQVSTHDASVRSLSRLSAADTAAPGAAGCDSSMIVVQAPCPRGMATVPARFRFTVAPANAA